MPMVSSVPIETWYLSSILILLTKLLFMPNIVLPKDELIREFQDFINVNGLWFEFKQFIKEKGYEIEEFGMQDEG